LEELILARDRLVKGTVVTVFKSCGNRNCKCRRGHKHGPFLYLSASVEGRTRTWHIPKGQEARIRTRAQSYKQFRTARERLVKIQQELVLLMNRIEAHRTEEVKLGGQGKHSKTKGKERGKGTRARGATKPTRKKEARKRQSRRQTNS